jgi:hypothetical protein
MHFKDTGCPREMAEMKRNLDEARDEATAAALGQFSCKNHSHSILVGSVGIRDIFGTSD